MSVLSITHTNFIQNGVSWLCLKEGCSGAVYPIYEHEGLKWVLMSVLHDHYEATVLPLRTEDLCIVMSR